ncbi:hypothetical protein ACFL6U_30415 [Planctomycetota bacterium]
MASAKRQAESTPTPGPDYPSPLCLSLERVCPECGGSMYEVDRREENGTLYRWLECVDTNCGHHWLDHLNCW